ENRAGLTDIERAVLEARYRDAQGKKPLAGVERIAGAVHLSVARVRVLLHEVMNKLRAALKRATVLTRIAQIAIGRRLRGEANASEMARLSRAQQDRLQREAQRSERRRGTRGPGLHTLALGAWGSHLMAMAHAAGIATYQQLASAI